MTDGIRHRQYGQTEREQHTDQTDAHIPKRRRQYGTAAATENQPECTDELRCQLLRHCHDAHPLLDVVGIVFVQVTPPVSGRRAGYCYAFSGSRAKRVCMCRASSATLLCCLSRCAPAATQRVRLSTAALARLSIAFQSLFFIRLVGATHEPPTVRTFGNSR
jgi:uncharacterized ParB-like nuclease family protein